MHAVHLRDNAAHLSSLRFVNRVDTVAEAGFVDSPDLIIQSSKRLAGSARGRSPTRVHLTIDPLFPTRIHHPSHGRDDRL
jgi:hypothetical protein